ncbi:MAG: FHA domain-containing protein, partial [Bdellovibrionota bacterium]
MSAQPAHRTGYKFLISIRVGPDQGATFQLLPPRVTIGRGVDNNVALTDPKVSRSAAIIEFAMDKITITDMSNRSSLSVNGETVVNASIKNGDLVKIGATEFQFMVEAIQLPATVSHQSPSLRTASDAVPFPPPPSGATKVQFGGAAYDRPFGVPPSQPSRPRQQNGKATFYIIVAAVGGLLVWLLTSSPVEKPVEQTLRTNDLVERDIASSEERLVALVNKRQFKNDEEETRYKEAQKHYQSGFRDYQKGQWLRAMRSFETARAIDPDHELSLRYMRLAEKQRDEMVALLTLEGRRYKEKNMYTRCSSALEKVLEAIPNKTE